MNNQIYQYSGNIKRVLFLIAIVIIFFLLYYSQIIVNRLRNESTNLVRFYAEVYAKAASDFSTEDFSFIFDQIIRRITIPMVISQNINSEPTAWKNIGIDESDFSERNKVRVTRVMADMDLANDPIPLKYENYILGYIHYGDTQLIKQLTMLPYVEILVVALFIFLGYTGFQLIRSAEKRSIWVGMAKETAHQLGTPISSLMGWVEILKDSTASNEILDEMSKDLKRLERISNRFSQIGSTPSFKASPLNQTIISVVEYYRKRMPKLSMKAEIEFDPVSDYLVKINPELLSWALENLIRNAIDSVPPENGKIEIVTGTEKSGKYVTIDVIDNGKGILKRNRKNIFRPGYSTKERGWGLGLSLARRIISEYHKGRIFVRESRPYEKTVIRIVLKREV